LTQELGLQREDVVENAVDPPAFEAVVGDDPGMLEMAAQGCAERSVDARLSPDLGLLEQLKATVER
jgi:hypothetical protein